MAEVEAIRGIHMHQAYRLLTNQQTKILKLAMDGGNFGQYALTKKKRRNVFVRWLLDRWHRLQWLPFDPINVIFKELHYWRQTISLIPLRIKRRRIAL